LRRARGEGCDGRFRISDAVFRWSVRPNRLAGSLSLDIGQVSLFDPMTEQRL
jgi:hypothetical protein